MNPLGNIKIYPATVTENNHGINDGKVQVSIPHLMDEVKQEHLPWASKFSSAGGGSEK